MFHFGSPVNISKRDAGLDSEGEIISVSKPSPYAIPVQLVLTGIISKKNDQGMVREL